MTAYPDCVAGLPTTGRGAAARDRRLHHGAVRRGRRVLCGVPSGGDRRRRTVAGRDRRPDQVRGGARSAADRPWSRRFASPPARRSARPCSPSGGRSGEPDCTHSGSGREHTLLTAARDKARFPWLDARPRPVQTRPRRGCARRHCDALGRPSAWRPSDGPSRAPARRRRSRRSSPRPVTLRSTLTVNAPDDLDRGTFCAESEVAGTKADISIRPHNGRLLDRVQGLRLAVNSVKRFNQRSETRPAPGLVRLERSSTPWRARPGVFRLKNLVDAQEKHIAIVWERDLGPLGDFLAAAR